MRALNRSHFLYKSTATRNLLRHHVAIGDHHAHIVRHHVGAANHHVAASDQSRGDEISTLTKRKNEKIISRIAQIVTECMRKRLTFFFF